MFTNDALVAWKYLNGLVCLYKPAKMSLPSVRKVLLTKLAEDLNKLKVRDQRNVITIEGNTSMPLTVTSTPSFSDHPLVVGPRYVPEDFRCRPVEQLGFNTSGVYVLGINDGCSMVGEISESQPLRVYQIKAQVGLATKNNFVDDIPTYKCNYHYLTKAHFDKVSAAVQAQNQKNLYQLLKIDLGSQEAYEMAATGLMRPATKKVPVIYSMKCIDFNSPNFTLEVSAINENEEYLIKLILDVGYQLKNVASVVSIRCIRHGFFSVEHAILKKHWTLENIFENMRTCYNIMEKSRKPHAHLERIID